MKHRFAWPEQREDNRAPYVSRRPGGYATYLKKRARRLLRRRAKADPENAPTKVQYRGFEY